MGLNFKPLLFKVKYLTLSIKRACVVLTLYKVKYFVLHPHLFSNEIFNARHEESLYCNDAFSIKGSRVRERVRVFNIF